MVEIKLNMYVRTPLGIAKYLGKYGNCEKLHKFDKLDEELWSRDIWGVVFECELKKIVLKASKNIIDLIECGDVIVGKDGHKFEVYAVGSDCVYINELKEFIFIDDIKAIITKEQIEANSYRIGDDDLSNCG